MKKLKYVYKVVGTIPSGKYISSSMYNNKYRLEYEIGKSTVSDPNTLGIFTFSAINFAEDFYFRYLMIYYRIILLCEPIGIINGKHIMCPNISENKLDYFYYNNLNLKVHTNTSGNSHLFNGTILCKAVKPLKVIKED